MNVLVFYSPGLNTGGYMLRIEKYGELFPKRKRTAETSKIIGKEKYCLTT